VAKRVNISRQHRLAYADLLYSVAGLLLLCLAAFAVARGFSSNLRTYASIQYAFNYHDGLIRRGLVSEVLSWIVDQGNPGEVAKLAVRTSIAAQILLLGCLTVWSALLERRRRDYVVLSLLAVFLAGQFVPMVAADVGYLDVYNFLLLVVAAAGFARHRGAIAIFAGLVGPFVHEGFVFPWMALSIVVLWEKISLSRILILLTPLLSTSIVFFGQSAGTVAAQLAAASLPADEKELAQAVLFGQSLKWNLDIMLWKFGHNAQNAFIAFIFFTLPALVIVAAYASLRPHKRDIVALALATFMPLTVLLVGWDLSRFLVTSSLFALVATLYMETVRPAPTSPWIVPSICCVTAVVFVQVPLVYAFLEHAQVIERRYSGIENLPIGQVTARGVRYYSRNTGPQFVSQVGYDQPPGDVWNVDEDAWRGQWVRRPGTNTFDAITRRAGGVVTYVVNVERAGDTIIARRDFGSDGSGRFDYFGKLDGNTVRGSYLGGVWVATIAR
jgi:hypothetical protein